MWKWLTSRRKMNKNERGGNNPQNYISLISYIRKTNTPSSQGEGVFVSDDTGSPVYVRLE